MNFDFFFFWVGLVFSSSYYSYFSYFVFVAWILFNKPQFDIKNINIILLVRKLLYINLINKPQIGENYPKEKRREGKILEFCNLREVKGIKYIL